MLPLVLAFCAALSVADLALAADEISTDVTTDLSGTVASDEDVVEDAGAGAPAKLDLGGIPAASDVIGYSLAPGGDALLSFDSTTSLPGGVTASPSDVVRWDGQTYSIELDGSDHAIPAGAQIDAIGVVQGDLLLSFDVTVALGNVTAGDEDLVRLESTQPDVWTLFFDGSAQGVPSGADLDGADVLDGNGHLALSFDVSGSLGGVAFDDEDILDFDPGSGTWAMRYDGSARHAALAAADVDAVFAPEPAGAALAIAAAVALASLAGARSRACSAN
jgi:hypothetical protein